MCASVCLFVERERARGETGEESILPLVLLIMSRSNQHKQSSSCFSFDTLQSDDWVRQLNIGPKRNPLSYVELGLQMRISDRLYKDTVRMHYRKLTKLVVGLCPCRNVKDSNNKILCPEKSLVTQTINRVYRCGKKTKQINIEGVRLEIVW